MQSRLIRTALLSLALTTLFIALPKDPANARHPHTDIHQGKTQNIGIDSKAAKTCKGDNSGKAELETDLPPDYYLRFDGIIELY